MEYRPLYHIFSEHAFLNDPNGLLYENGRYHLFHQWNPCYPGSKSVGWAHLVSKDLVHWQALPPALLPENTYDRDGCYSGSAVLKDGRIHLLYTGNLFDEQGLRHASQCLAISEDGARFVKYAGNPVIDGSAPGYTAHFRDPYVFHHGDVYAFVLGAQTDELKGRALLYRSNDLTDWQLDGPLVFDSPALDHFGYMWECPNLFELEDGGSKRAVLLFCPQGIAPHGMDYQNRYQCGYLIAPGPFAGKNTFLGAAPFQELDHGFEFYAPQVFSDGARTLLVGWMGMPEEDRQPSAQEGWMHCLTVPRVLTLENGRIRQQPVPELDALHGAPRMLPPCEVTDGSMRLEGFSGDCYDMQLELDLTAARACTVSLREGAGQCIRVTFENGVCTVDRALSAYAPGNPVRQARLAQAEHVRLRVLSDRSAMELFVNDGDAVFSLRTYLDTAAADTSIKTVGRAVCTAAIYYSMHEA